MKPVDTPPLADADTEKMRRAFAAALRELQGLPAAGMRIRTNVVLKDGVATPVAHGLGRLPAFVLPSPPRGPVSTGRIEEIRDGTEDRTLVVILKATGFGAPITLEVGFL